MFEIKQTHPIAIYVRVSTDDQQERKTIESKIEFAKKGVHQYGKRSTKQIYLLTSLIKCKNCGYTYQSVCSKGASYYQCEGRIKHWLVRFNFPVIDNYQLP